MKHTWALAAGLAAVLAWTALAAAAAGTAITGGGKGPGGTTGGTTGGTSGGGQGSISGTGTVGGGIYAIPAGGGTGVGAGVIQDDPEVQHAAYKKKAEDDYNAGVKAMAAGDMETATRLLIGVVELSKMGIDSPYPAQAYAQLEIIAAQATKELAVARSLVADEDPAAGLAELKRIARVYSGLPPAKMAGALSMQLAADPQFQAMLRAARLAEDLKKAEALEALASAALDPPAAPPETGKAAGGAVSVTQKILTEKERQVLRIARLAEAYDAYGRIVDAGGSTDPAKAAAAARARLEQDKDLMVRVKEVQAERKAREWLGLAEAYYKAGLIDRAREFCQKILSDCPQAPQTAEARALLERMKRQAKRNHPPINAD